MRLHLSESGSTSSGQRVLEFQWLKVFGVSTSCSEIISSS